MTILVSSLARAPGLIAERRPERIVSLLDPASPFPHPGESQHLRLEIHDIDLHEPHLTAPHETHVRDIIAFVEGWSLNAPILIHCWAGVSRSTATAFITACIHNPSTDEEEIAWALRRASPTATPNRRLVALADAELGRGGRMIAAAERIGRGVTDWQSFIEAHPFELTGRFEAPE
jgi:predicted protein tyrosine phosphatase